MSKITEDEAIVAIDIQLTAAGWCLDPRKVGRDVFKQRAKTDDQNNALKTAKGQNRPDYVLYAHNNSDKPSVVIEARRPGKSLSNALDDAINKYANKISAPIAIASDGWRVKTWHIGRNEPLFIDGHEVEELFSPAITRDFIEDNNFNSFSKDVKLEPKELIAKFKKANDILKSEGLSAGVERFSEFANLMFLKLYLEDEYSDMSIAGFSWSDIETRQGPKLVKAIRLMFSELREKHGKLFEQTQIKNPKHMERLVELLSSFRLSSMRHDVKGIAFEHFIHSYTRGTKNDLGQYFTPRHIVRMMVHFLRPQIGEKIYDPFCGTGGMLIECFRYINQHIDTPKHKKILKENTLFGRDNASVARIAMMNMIMFGDGHTNIQRGDSFALLGETKNQYDVVITNIPFSQETDFYEGYPVVPTGQKNGDSIGVQHCLESISTTPSARAGIIVPIGFLYKSELTEERKYILENWHVDRIVELSPKCFQPYTEQQTAVLFLSRKKPETSYPYYRIHNDGYSQDAYRIALPGENDIDMAMDGVGGETMPVQTEEHARFKNISIHVRKSEIALDDIAVVTSGANNISPKTKIGDVLNGIHPIMMVADLAETHINYNLSKSRYKLTKMAVENKKPHQFGKYTTIIPVTGKASLKNHRAMLAVPAYATSTLAGIEAKQDKIHPYILFYYFLKFDIENITYDLGYPGVSPKIIKQLGIPNYTDKQQNDIIARIGDAVKLSSKLDKIHGEIEQG